MIKSFTIWVCGVLVGAGGQWYFVTDQMIKMGATTMFNSTIEKGCNWQKTVDHGHETISYLCVLKGKK